MPAPTVTDTRPTSDANSVFRMTMTILSESTSLQFRWYRKGGTEEDLDLFPWKAIWGWWGGVSTPPGTARAAIAHTGVPRALARLTAWIAEEGPGFPLDEDRARAEFVVKPDVPGCALSAVSAGSARASVSRFLRSCLEGATPGARPGGSRDRPQLVSCVDGEQK